jgi:hypothetical protein
MGAWKVNFNNSAGEIRLANMYSRTIVRIVGCSSLIYFFPEAHHITFSITSRISPIKQIVDFWLGNSILIFQWLKLETASLSK